MGEFASQGGYLPRRGLLLTSGGYRVVSETFLIFRKLNSGHRDLGVDDFCKYSDALKDFSHKLWLPHWSDFDSVYCSMYMINCTTRRSALRQNAHSVLDGQKLFAHIDILLDIEFQKVTPLDNFEDTLLDETKIANIMKIKHHLDAIVDYPLSLRAINFGCLFLSFDVWVSDNFKGKFQDLPGLSTAQIEGGNDWRAFRSTFPVAEINFRAV